jgi:hypothetical protein
MAAGMAPGGQHIVGTAGQQLGALGRPIKPASANALAHTGQG